MAKPLLCSLAACGLSLAWLALPPSPAFAQDTETQELSKARAKFQQATELERAGDYGRALAIFREVGQVKMTPQVRFHIAVCEEKLGRLVAALGGYDLALADADSVGPTFRSEVEQRMQSLRERTPRLVIERGPGAESAVVELDGIRLSAASIGVAMPVDPGPHGVSAKSPGRRDSVQTVTLAEGDEKTVRLELVPLADEPEPAPRSTPVERAPEGRPSRVLPYVIGGVGVASLAASGVFFVLRGQAISDLEEVCGPNGDECPADSKDTYDDAKTYNVAAQVALGVGVLGVGVAAALLITSGSSEEAPARSGLFVGPAPAGSPLGASLIGRF